MHTKANKQKSIQNLNITNSIEVTIIGVARRPAPTPNRNATNDKNETKNLSCFFIFSFFQHLCIKQYKRTTVITKNIDDLETRAPSISFCQQT